MRKCFLVILVLAGLGYSTNIQAQALSDSLTITKGALRPYNEYKLGIGIRADPNRNDFTLSAKYFLSSNWAMQLTAGKAQNFNIATFVFERHHFIFHSRKLRFLYGGGITKLFPSKDEDRTTIGAKINPWATITAGFEYNLRRLPLSLSIDARLHYYRLDKRWVGSRMESLAGSVHYTFGKK